LTKKASDIFTVTFLGEYVEIVCKTGENEQGQLIVKGYLLDVDNDYYYIGHNPLEVSGAVKKDLVGVITITEDVDPMMEALETFEVEEDDKGH
jgi:hypothetical protein